jgi:S1-C subfamily serine protease
VLVGGILLLGGGSPCAAQLSAEENATVEIFERLSPSVVFIKNASLQWDWFSAYAYEVPQGAGSGFVWDTRGHIVTNFHVIYQADKIEVVLSDQKSYAAKVVGVSPEHDLAVLKIEAPASTLKQIPIGGSKGLKVGQKALSIGNPFGLDHSLTTGVVSALGRSMTSMVGRTINDVIQTDAAINPGNSGGPLLDSAGRLIGVSTAIYSPSGAYAGVGFAIPVDTVRDVIPQLIQYGKVKRVGLEAVLVPDNLRQRLGFEGAMVLDARRGGAADQAGLRPTRRNSLGQVIYGDVIISVDGRPVKNNESLIDVLAGDKKQGDKVNIRFLREGKEYGTTAVLQEIN